jgi:hypothetical protein
VIVETEMTDEPDLYVVALPEVCKPCGNELLTQVKRQTKMYRIAHFCPHTETLIHADIGEHEGKRAVTRWGIVGPMSEAEALAQIAELAERDGVDLEVLHDSERLH